MNTILKYIWIACKEGYYTATKKSRTINAVVLHSTDGRKGGDIPTLTGQTSRRVSVHWYVTRDGTIYHFVEESQIAWQAGKVVSSKYNNTHTIGIEQEHFDYKDNWPDVQVKATALIIAHIRKKYGSIPVKSHAEISTIGKVDPANYPWDKLKIFVSEYMKSEITPQAV